MKKIKVFLLLLIALILTGCSGTYNIKINTDLSVDEEVDLSIKENKDTYDKTVKIFKDNKVNKNKYKVVKTNGNIKITYKEKYSSLEDYILNSKAYRNLFDNINYNKTEDEISISTNSKLNLEGNQGNIVNNYDISFLQINVQSDYKIINNNADSSEKSIYTWSLNNKTYDKDISFVLDFKHKKNDYIQIIVLSLIGVITLFGIIFVLTKLRNSDKLS